MSLKDRFDRFIDYFTEDEDLSLPNEKRDEPILTPVNSTQEKALSTNQTPSTSGTKENNITRLHARQQELAKQNQHSTEKVTIDVRYPRKYEDAIEIVDLLAGNESILIDFQYMTEVQARRCLDYLDGACHVLAGNLKKVASTMYLLTPVNVIVNIEDIRLPDEDQQGEFDFDMRRNRALVKPVLAPLQRLPLQIAGLDLSIWVAIVLIRFLGENLVRFLAMIG